MPVKDPSSQEGSLAGIAAVASITLAIGVTIAALTGHLGPRQSTPTTAELTPPTPTESVASSPGRGPSTSGANDASPAAAAAAAAAAQPPATDRPATVLVPIAPVPGAEVTAAETPAGLQEPPASGSRRRHDDDDDDDDEDRDD